MTSPPSLYLAETLLCLSSYPSHVEWDQLRDQKSFDRRDVEKLARGVASVARRVFDLDVSFEDDLVRNIRDASEDELESWRDVFDTPLPPSCDVMEKKPMVKQIYRVFVHEVSLRIETLRAKRKEREYQHLSAKLSRTTQSLREVLPVSSEDKRLKNLGEIRKRMARLHRESLSMRSRYEAAATNLDAVMETLERLAVDQASGAFTRPPP